MTLTYSLKLITSENNNNVNTILNTIVLMQLLVCYQHLIRVCTSVWQQHLWVHHHCGTMDDCITLHTAAALQRIAFLPRCIPPTSIHTWSSRAPNVLDIVVYNGGYILNNKRLHVNMYVCICVLC